MREIALVRIEEVDIVGRLLRRLSQQLVGEVYGMARALVDMGEGHMVVIELLNDKPHFIQTVTPQPPPVGLLHPQVEAAILRRAGSRLSTTVVAPHLTRTATWAATTALSPAPDGLYLRVAEFALVTRMWIDLDADELKHIVSWGTKPPQANCFALDVAELGLHDVGPLHGRVHSLGECHPPPPAPWISPELSLVLTRKRQEESRRAPPPPSVPSPARM